MTKWPDRKKFSDYNAGGNSIRAGNCQSHMSGANEMLDACIEAEKNGRMGVEDIKYLLSCVPLSDLPLPIDFDKIRERYAKAIYIALYGDTKPDERKK